MSSRYPTVAVLPGTGPESDEEGGSVSSRGSGVSQAAGPDETVRFTDLVNLHSRACRVVLQPRDGITRVCGNPRATCTRQRHQGMGEDRRAAPGYYVAHTSRKGERDGDEGRPWDAARALALRDRDREEEARNLNAVDHGTEDESPGVPVPGNEGGTEVPLVPPVNAPRPDRSPPTDGGVGRGSGPVEGEAPQGMTGTPSGVPSPGTGGTGTRWSAAATTGGGGTPTGPGLGRRGESMWDPFSSSHLSR